MKDNNSMKECIASRLRSAREMAGLSQGQVAKMLGMHRPTISEIEAGRRNVTAEELKNLSSIYDVSISWLACDDSNESNIQKDKMYLAARELSKMKDEDIDHLFTILKSMKKGRD